MESILLVRFFLLFFLREGGIVSFSRILFCVGPEKAVTKDCQLH